MKLSENIRALRRERHLTQEQLAEVMGVSTAAVSKWESGVSTPELPMLTSLADYFEVSIDLLIGFEVRSHREDEELRRITALSRQHRDQEALDAANALLRRYPNSFESVVAAMKAHFFLGLQRSDESLLRQALALVDRALPMLRHTENPSVTQQDLLLTKGQLYACLQDYEQAIVCYQRSDFRKCNSALLGSCRVSLKQYDQAMPLLSAGFLDSISQVFDTVLGMATCLSALHRHGEAEAILRWMLNALIGLETGPSSYVWRMRAILHLGLAEVLWDQDRRPESEAAIRQAADCALRFDRAPDLSLNSLRFCYCKEYILADSLGASTLDGLIRTLDEEENHDHYRPLRDILEQAKEDAHGQA